MTALRRYDESASLPAKVSKQFSNLLKAAEGEANSIANVSVARAQRLLKFLDTIDQEGMSDSDFARSVKRGLELADSTGDPKAYHRMLETWRKLVYEAELQLGTILGQSSIAINTVLKQVNNNNADAPPSEEDLELIALEREIERRERDNGSVEAEVVAAEGEEGGEA